MPRDEEQRAPAEGVVWIVRMGKVRGEGDYVDKNGFPRGQRLSAERHGTRRQAKSFAREMTHPARVVRLRRRVAEPPLADNAQISDAIEIAESALFTLAKESPDAQAALDKVQPVAFLLRKEIAEKRATVRELVMRPGHTTVGADMPHWAMALIAQSLYATLADAPNFVEHTTMATMEMPELVVTVQRRHGKSPAQFLAETRVDLDAAKARAAAAEELLGHATRFAFGRFGAGKFAHASDDGGAWYVRCPPLTPELKALDEESKRMPRDEAIAKARELAVAAEATNGGEGSVAP